MEAISKALGMKILIAECKSVPDSDVRAGGTAFDEVLKTCNELMIGCPLDDGTRDMITKVELRQMRTDSMAVNLAWGGVMDEASLVKALDEGWIACVFDDRHASLETLQTLVKTTLESYVVGKPQT
ncbi:Uu.00g058720.m01.CDS01 [Anthostomella pinea]|uniref:Uu.00g058720.m01.CDS01 n=1 Tax=Anthostomella pinea TaxID=933095 RepID=A0AAI8VT42_9PEZI|nr:Uu.00g058720.m01.CDS01 [Anthostomella pinea]